jgi:hypothetical protein
MTFIAPRYFVIARDQLYRKVAVFDSWEELSYTKMIRDVSTCSLKLRAEDPRTDLFKLDGILQVFRSLPGLPTLPGPPTDPSTWTQEYIGLHRGWEYEYAEDGNFIMTSLSVGLNDLLARTIINYPEGTIKSYKNIAAETAMKEYVEENCGPTALIIPPYERVIDGVLPDFTVEPTTGLGAVWEGDRSMQNLLDVIKDISQFANLDFDIEWVETPSPEFTFKVYPNQVGTDRSVVGLDRTTGLNGAGNVPVIFEVSAGTVSKFNFVNNRTSESNVVSILGDGDGATRTIVTRVDPSSTDSPWNRREIARPGSGFISQMEIAGDEALNEFRAKTIISIDPLNQPNLAYGKHYFVGDVITTYFKSVPYNRRILGATIEAKIDGSQKLILSEVS